MLPTRNVEFLIAFMHKLHEEYLDKLGIDLVTQVEHQEKMLLWLDGELFDQIDGLPVLAFSRKFNPLHGNIFTHHSLGPIQKQLIMYFSQDKDSLDLLPYTGHFVLKNFNDQHQSEHPNFSCRFFEQIADVLIPKFTLLTDGNGFSRTVLLTAASKRQCCLRERDS